MLTMWLLSLLQGVSYGRLEEESDPEDAHGGDGNGEGGGGGHGGHDGAPAHLMLLHAHRGSGACLGAFSTGNL